jgi:tRNA(His) 5'-end guanylyltransferase
MYLKHDAFGDRLKVLEDKYRFHLEPKLPVILRLDGKNFSTLTKNLKKPFDENLIQVMNEIMIYLCKNIQCAQISYSQSDEISILIHHKNETSQPWFGNNLQKIVSVSAAMASGYFVANSHKIFGETKLVEFDSRAFTLPHHEVNNVFYWRQSDCERNSVQSVARSLFSHKECNNKDVDELKELCLTKNVNWDELPTYQRRGRCAVKRYFEKEGEHGKTGEKFIALRSEWVIDNEIPNFSQDKNYIEQYIK